MSSFRVGRREGPFGLDSRALTSPTAGSGSRPGGDESFTIGGTATVDGNDLKIGLAEKAARFATGDRGTFDTSAVPDPLNARIAGTC